MKLLKLPTDGKPFSAATAAAIEASNNRAAVKELRYIVRRATDSLQGDINRLGLRSILRVALSSTAPRKLRGR